MALVFCLKSVAFATVYEKHKKTLSAIVTNSIIRFIDNMILLYVFIVLLCSSVSIVLPS